ncbi:hypothetical protein NECAME_11587 [Necator americanus]|uniref:Uncharacterized protein n=1 Tax=Necator americanus TaxID=51031 RepID=W2T6G7_NECAM|nr:hypothetical protein NECAME_11587 [Necator americanus]ETN76582.1 hypothetical protein NECAME_11587 [Necator americanus]
MDECSVNVESPVDPEQISTATSATSSPRNGTTSEECSQIQSLYGKYSTQQKEIERLEEQNAEYREKLLKTIRERDLNDELLRNVREAHKKEVSELERRLRDYEIQLKAVQDRASAQEAHYNVTMKDLSLKYNTSVSQLTKKADVAEKEKNDAVIKYATREAEMMRMRSEVQKKDQELQECRKAKEELEQCQSQENVEQLEKSNSNLRIEIEHIKHEKFDMENRLKMAEKRAEACTTSVTELRQQCDVLRKQLIQSKEEKAQLQEEHRQLSLKTQVQESRRQHESQELSKSQQDLEQRLAEANSNIACLSEANREVNGKLEDVTRENLDLLNKLQDLEDKLSLEEEAHSAASIELSRLQGIENQVLSYKRTAERAKAAQEQAEKEREVAEQEAEECRQQAERMLAITEQLTQRNSQLASDVSADREKNCRLEQQLVETEGSLSRALSKLAEREKDLEEATGSGQSEIASLKSELNEKIIKVQELSQRLQEERTDHAALKKKYLANIKELKHELSSLRKQMDTNTGNAPLAPPPSGDSAPSTSSRSRASSLNSLDRVTTVSRDEDGSQAGNAVPSESNAIQQVMIDKVPLSRKGASYSLMGTIFSAGSDKRSLQLAAEVNSRLQAVLEDALMKNITLKSSVDSLSNEVSRLSRENRQLTLTHSRCSEQHV